MKREVEKRVGDKDSQGISRSERQPDTPHLSQGLGPPRGRKTGYTDVVLLREARERLEMGTQEF